MPATRKRGQETSVSNTFQDALLSSTQDAAGPTGSIKSLCISMLVEGRPQAFVDFFYLTHKDDEHAQLHQTAQHGGSGGPEVATQREELPPESVQLLKEQLVQAEAAVRTGDVEGEYAANRVLAQYFSQAGKLHKATLFFEKCLQVAQDHAWVEAELEASIALGHMHEALGDVDISLQYHESSLQLASDNGWQAEVEASHRSLVKAYSAQAERQEAEGNTTEALEWLHKCLAAAESAADMVEIGVIYYRMGLLHQKAGAAADALACFQRYLDICCRAGDQAGQCRAHFGVAEAEQALGNTERATAALEVYLDLTKLEDPLGQATACCSLGNIYFEQRQMRVAVTYFEQFFELARTLNDRRMLDAARVNLGVARGLLRFPDYVKVVEGNLPALLAWKNTRTPFQVAAA